MKTSELKDIVQTAEQHMQMLTSQWPEVFVFRRHEYAAICRLLEDRIVDSGDVSLHSPGHLHGIRFYVADSEPEWIALTQALRDDGNRVGVFESSLYGETQV